MSFTHNNILHQTFSFSPCRHKQFAAVLHIFSTDTANMSQKFQFASWPKVIGAIFGSDSTDCCFQFRDETSNEIEEIHAHRKLLVGFSSVFATMFNSTWGESSSGRIQIADASAKAFKTFLGYFHTGEIELDSSNIKEIFYLAHKYDITELVSSCATFSSDNLSADNAVQYYYTGIRYDRDI